MRFLPSVPWRTVARVGLTMAVLGVVAYDLCGRVVKPEGATSSSAVVSLEAKGKTAAVGTSFVVCGDVAAPTNPFTLSSASTYQSLLIYLSGCKIAPIIGDGVGGLASIVVGSDGWLSFQSVQIASPIPAGAIAGALSMATGSNLEVVISTALVPYPRTTVSYPLLTASSGACPTLSTLNQVITNCPADPTIPAYLGSYQCSVAVVPTGILGCNISLSIAGPLVWPSSLYTIQFCKQCALTFTPAMLLAAIYYTTGIGAAAIDVISWSGPLPYVVGFKVYASSTLIANAAAGVIIASAKAGTLNNYLGVMYAGLGYLPPEQFTKTCLCDKFYPVLGPGNGSNPDLLILLVLLAIPVLAVIAAFVYLYCISLPKPAPEPMCPAAPLMAAAMPMAMASTAYSPMGVMPTTL